MLSADRIALAGAILAVATALVGMGLEASGYLSASVAKVLVWTGAAACFVVLIWLVLAPRRGGITPDTPVHKAIDYMVNDSSADLERAPPPRVMEFGPAKGRVVHRRGVEHADAITQLTEALTDGRLQAWGARSLDHESERAFDRYLRPIPQTYWENHSLHLIMSLAPTDRYAQTARLFAQASSDYLFTRVTLSATQLHAIWKPLPFLTRLLRRVRRYRRITYYDEAGQREAD